MTTPVLNGWNEIAKFLKVHEQTAMAWANNHGLPVARIGNAVMSTQNALESWLLENMKHRKEKL